MSKTFKIVDGDISDGYHTFDELYEHRCLLYAAWVQMVRHCIDVEVYWVPEHFEGWDLLVVEMEGVGQVSYHLPEKLRYLYERNVVKALDEHTFDGHTPDEVLKRIDAFVCSRDRLLHEKMHSQKVDRDNE